MRYTKKYANKRERKKLRGVHKSREKIYKGPTGQKIPRIRRIYR